jgi:hypothetical protein
MGAWRLTSEAVATPRAARLLEMTSMEGHWLCGHGFGHAPGAGESQERRSARADRGRWSGEAAMPPVRERSEAHEGRLTEATARSCGERSCGGKTRRSSRVTGKDEREAGKEPPTCYRQMVWSTTPCAQHGAAPRTLKGPPTSPGSHRSRGAFHRFSILCRRRHTTSETPS